MGTGITSTFETNHPIETDETTSMGVSAGDGMIHYVLLTRDGVGRNVVDSRVIDVDQTDGLDTAGRVNAGIDLMLDAAREADQKVGPIGIAARTATQRRRLRSSGSGPRRQVQLSSDEEAVVAYLTGSGEIDRFDSVVVADCGDTGMSLYTVEPKTGRISDIHRSHVLSGRRLDRIIAGTVAANLDSAGDFRGGRGARASLLSLCRTAKEEVGTEVPASDSTPDPTGSGLDRVRLTPAIVDSAARGMLTDARAVVTRYLADADRRGVHPQALVLVGGLANLPAVREVADTAGLEVVVPSAPELAAATGAAMLAGSSSGAASRLAFIGGRRHRQWWSAAPVAIVGAVLAAALLTIYAISSSLTGERDSVAPTVTTPASTTVDTSDTADTTPIEPTRTTRENELPPVQRPVTTTMPHDDAYPGWVTTELPPTGPSTTTRTLSPNPQPVLPETSTPVTPSEPSEPSTRRPTLPKIPPNLIPSDLLPSVAAPEPTPPTQNRRIPAPTPPAPTGPATTTTTPAR
ncbi:hypothetical protein GCM10009624_21820 [Gordonia sinesedis]